MRLIETGSFPLAEIDMGERLRTVDEAWAEALACSIADTGLQNPLQVMKIGNTFRLIAGAHRKRAAELLEWTEVPVKIYEPETEQPEMELRLAEVEENLSRRELSALDRAAAMAERQRILKALHGETRGRKEKNVKLTLFSINEAVADKLKVSKSQVDRAVSLFNGLSSASRARVAGTWLAHNQAQLTAMVTACRVPELLSPEDAADKQARILDLLFCDPPKAKTVQDAVLIIEKRPKAEKDTRAELIERVDKAWWNMDGRTKKQMLLKLRDYGVIITADQVVTGARARPKG